MKTPPAGSVKQLVDYGLRAPAVMRAMGSVEAAQVTLRKRVLIGQDEYTAKDGEPGTKLSYSYFLSGVDFGLQGGHELGLMVEGCCDSEYSWFRDVEPQFADEMDLYHLWGINGSSTEQLVNLDTSYVKRAPTAGFYLHPRAETQKFEGGSNVSYAIIVFSAHRTSTTKGGDVWYATEPRNETDERYNATFQVMRRRPALSCWEKNTWAYRSHNMTSVYDLKGIPDIKIAQVLLEVLEITLGGEPMIVRLGNAAGDSVLRSRTTSPNGVISAQESSAYSDMERLILASFVATRSIFTDATMFGTQNTMPQDNVFLGGTSEPVEGAGEFVVSSPDIQTFSLTGMVTLAVILCALLLANCAVSFLVQFNQDRRSDYPHHDRHAFRTRYGHKHGYSNLSISSQPSNVYTLGVSANTRCRTRSNSATLQATQTIGLLHIPDSGSTIDLNPKATAPGPEVTTAMADESQITSNHPNANNKWTRFHVLKAVQLFRCMYEPGDSTESRTWSCRRPVPFEQDGGSFRLVEGRCGEYGCKGHVDKTTVGVDVLGEDAGGGGGVYNVGHGLGEGLGIGEGVSPQSIGTGASGIGIGSVFASSAPVPSPSNMSVATGMGIASEVSSNG